MKLKWHAEVLNGYAFKSEEFAEEGIPIVRQSNLKSGKIVHDGKCYPSYLVPAKFMLKDRDICIGLSGSVENFGVVDDTALPCALNQRVGVLRAASGKASSHFIEYLVQSGLFKHHIASNLPSTTIVNIDAGLVGNAPFPDFDLATQRQIADFLDRETARIDLLIEKKQRLIASLGEQRSAAISSAVTVGLTDGADLVPTNSQYLPHVPATWRVWRLKHLAEIRGGLTLGRSIPGDAETTLTPYMRVANVQAGWLDLGDVAEIPVTKVERRRYRLQEGDVLMNEGGDNDKLGRGAVWKSEIETCVHQNHVFAVRPHDIRYSDWISLATNARYARDFFFLHSNQSTNLASISKTNLARFPVAVPPFDEMRTTLNALRLRVGKLDRITEKTNASIDGLKEYRSALITAAVTDQIDVTTYAKSGPLDRQLDAIQEEMGA